MSSVVIAPAIPATLTGRPLSPRPDDESDTVLSVGDVLKRRKEQHSAHYLDLYNVMKGVTLAVAGLSLLEIVVRHSAMGRLLLWLAAFAGAVLTYYGAIAGAALLNHRPALPDIFIPMLLAVSELMLVYRPGLGLDARHPEWIPTDWFALLAAWSLLCGCVIVTVSLGLKSGLEAKAYSEKLELVVEDYRDRLRVDYRMAFGTGLLSLAVFLAWRVQILSDSRWAEGGVAVVALGSIVGGIYSQRQSSREIDDNLRQVP